MPTGSRRLGPVRRNTATDADGDTANLTFQVYTTNVDATPKAQVDLDGSGQHGVLVSPYVASGGTAQVTVPYGKLKPGVLYKFRTSPTTAVCTRRPGRRGRASVSIRM